MPKIPCCCFKLSSWGLPPLQHSLIMLLYMHYACHNDNKITYIATGSAVVPPPCQSIERLFTFHTHCHFIVADPTRGTLPQLCILY